MIKDIDRSISYRVLELVDPASQEEIKKSYRRLVKEWHPDINPDDPEAEERFKEIQQAYNLLINEDPPSDQSTENQWDNQSFSAMQDHPMQTLREMAVRYYAERSWFRNKPVKG